MNRPRLPADGFPLFRDESEIWNSLDKATQEAVLDCLALPLLRYLQQTAREAAAERLTPDSTTDIHNTGYDAKGCAT